MSNLSLHSSLLPQPQHDDAIDGAMLQFCTFWLDKVLFGINIINVQEIAMAPELTTVHHAPKYVAGVVNIRGQIILCLDLRNIFNLPSASRTSESRLILFKPSVGKDFGILVDEVGDIVEVRNSSVEQRRRMHGTRIPAGINGTEAVCGICKLEVDLMLILDAERLLKDLENPSREQ